MMSSREQTAIIGVEDGASAAKQWPQTIARREGSRKLRRSKEGPQSQQVLTALSANAGSSISAYAPLRKEIDVGRSYRGALGIADQELAIGEDNPPAANSELL